YSSPPTVRPAKQSVSPPPRAKWMFYGQCHWVSNGACPARRTVAPVLPPVVLSLWPQAAPSRRRRAVRGWQRRRAAAQEAVRSRAPPALADWSGRTYQGYRPPNPAFSLRYRSDVVNRAAQQSSGANPLDNPSASPGGT